MFTTIVDQRAFGGNVRSMVGPGQRHCPLLRMLFSRVGTPSARYSPSNSFNDPSGMCPRCEGLGTVDDTDLELLLDRGRSLNEGAIGFVAFRHGTYCWKRLVHSGLVDPDVPLGDLAGDDLQLLLHAEKLVVLDGDDGRPVVHQPGEAGAGSGLASDSGRRRGRCR